MPTWRGTGASSRGCGSSSGSGCWRRCPSSTRRHRPRRPPGRCGDHAGPLAVGTSRTAGAPAGRDPRGCVGPDHADGGAREALSRGACDRRTKPRAVAQPLARGAGARGRELSSLEIHVGRGACPQAQRARGARALAPHATGGAGAPARAVEERDAGGAGTAPAAVSQPAAASRPGAAEVTWLALVLLTLGALTGCGAPAFGAGAAPPTGAAPADALRVAPPLAEARRILHVLNRVGFGPRPGDV